MSERVPRVSGYEILGVLGQGGMGCVYRARDITLNREVALKVLAYRAAPNDEEREDAEARFRREIRIHSRLVHPNVVRLYDAEMQDDLIWIAMELVEGRSLRAAMREQPQHPPEQAYAIIRQVIAGLAYLHENEIAHRDIKPENVLLGADGTARVADLGLARDPTSTVLTAAGAFIGTLHYMAPEVVRQQPAGPEVDVYGVGLMLHEMLAGKLPYPVNTPSQLILAIAHQPPQPITEVRSDVGPRVEALIIRCLAKKPAERPTARQLVADFAAPDEQDGAAPAIRPASRTPRLSSRPDQNRTPRQSAAPALRSRRTVQALGVFGTVVLLVTSGWFVSRPETPRPVVSPSTGPASAAPSPDPGSVAAQGLSAVGNRLARVSGSRDSRSTARRLSSELEAAPAGLARGARAVVDRLLDDRSVGLRERLVIWRDLGRLQEAARLIDQEGLRLGTWLDLLMESPFVYHAPTADDENERVYMQFPGRGLSDRLDLVSGLSRYEKEYRWNAPIARPPLRGVPLLRLTTYKLSPIAVVRTWLDGISLPSLVRADRTKPHGGERWEIRLPAGLLKPSMGPFVFRAGALLGLDIPVEAKLTSAWLYPEAQPSTRSIESLRAGQQTAVTTGSR